MKSIVLPAGTEHCQFGELAHLIAIALHPFGDNATDREMMAYGGARTNLEAELLQAVSVGTLPVKDPLTLGPHTFPVGDALRRSRVMVDDLRQFVAGRLSVEIAPTASPVTVVAEIDLTMVATRDELIEAFGKFTGMDKSWFDNLTGTPRLMAARKFTGQGGRNSAQPLFCPYEVMQWLADPKRKKGKPLSDTTAWRLLKNNFPKVYNQYSIGDPNAD